MWARSLSSVLVVFRKEWVDALRDRRSLLSGMIFPLAMPILLGVMLATLVGGESHGLRATVGIGGASGGTELRSHLVRQGFVLRELGDAPENVEDAVRDGTVPVGIYVSEAFSREFGAGRPARVSLVYNSSLGDLSAFATLQQEVALFAAEVGSLRLIARGVDPRLASPIDVRAEDVATPHERASRFLMMVPFFLVLAAFMGGMHVAIDTTAGERERGSLEPLLLNPVPRVSIVTGKWLVAGGFSLGSSVITGLCGVLVLWLSPLAEAGIRFQVASTTWVGLAVAVVPMALLSSSLQVLVASCSHSFREAQTYVALLLLLPLLPGIWLTLYPPDFGGLEYAIPILSQVQIASDALGGRAVSFSAAVLSAGVVVVLSVLAVLTTARLFSGDRIISKG